MRAIHRGGVWEDVLCMSCVPLCGVFLLCLGVCDDEEGGAMWCGVVCVLHRLRCCCMV